MESKVQKLKKNTDITDENDGVTAEKIKFPLYVFPETMKTVDILYKSENCSARTEFMEKASASAESAPSAGKPVPWNRRFRYCRTDR